MPTVTGEKFDLLYTGRPTGMSMVDFSIWEKYKQDINPNYEGVYFNVHVGAGIDPGEEFAERDRKFWIEKTQLRIDVLIVYKERVVIVELRDSASSSAIGRLLAYRSLYLDDNIFERPVILELATNFYKEIVARMCNEHEIVYRVI